MTTVYPHMENFLINFYPQRSWNCASTENMAINIDFCVQHQIETDEPWDKRILWKSLGLAVLAKHSATLRLYDSMYNSCGFEHIIPDIIHLTNSISVRYELTQTEWPIQWTYSREVYSV